MRHVQRVPHGASDVGWVYVGKRMLGETADGEISEPDDSQKKLGGRLVVEQGTVPASLAISAG